jgi:hypothetical protein
LAVAAGPWHSASEVHRDDDQEVERLLPSAAADDLVVFARSFEIRRCWIALAAEIVHDDLLHSPLTKGSHPRKVNKK